MERANKEINRYLKAFTFDSATVSNWRLALPMVQRIMNATFSNRTKLSASQLLFGRGIFIPSPEINNEQPLSDYMGNLINLQNKLMNIARFNLKLIDNEHIVSYPAARTDFEPGSFVLVKYREGSAPTRLHTNWKGPLRVVSGAHSQFLLLDLVTHKENVYHVTDMKPFLFDPALTDPLDVSRRDYLKYFVESIIGHRGNSKSRKQTYSF